MQKEYKDDQIGDLEGDEGVDPLQFIEENENDEQEFYDYGDLSDTDDIVSNAKMSKMDMIEQKQIEDNQIINEAVDEFI